MQTPNFNNKRLIITWIPDVLSMIEHDGSFTGKHKVTRSDSGELIVMDNNYKGLTTRSERESFKNIETKEKAEKILSKRNKSQIQFATYNNEVIYTENQKIK